LKTKKFKLAAHPPRLPDDPEALVALARATAEFESKFVSVYEFDRNSPNPSQSPTGERYQEIIEGAGPQVGDRPTGRFQSSDDAIKSWLSRILMMVPSEPSSLYWRVRPEINCFPRSRYNPGGWAIYSRFLISDKPRKS
jgi:hypothetical protein